MSEIRLCDRCRNVIPNEPYMRLSVCSEYGVMYLEKFDRYDLCDECKADFDKWFTDGQEVEQ